MFEKGKHPCPDCKANYIPWMESQCLSCYLKEHPEFAEVLRKAKERKEEWKRIRAQGRTRRKQYLRHPCGYRKQDQGCRRGTGQVCGFSDKKAHQCPTFKQKIMVGGVS
jgi:hypothetical protein